MATENEPIEAEKMRKRKFVAIFGQCLDCGQPVLEGQEFFRSDDGIRHALCEFDPIFAKHARELKAKSGQ
jgi:hypothetical protein